MASLFDNLKKNTTLNVDKGALEIQKKVAKKKVSSFLGAFTGVRPTETDQEKEAKRRAAAKRDEYREEHNKLFTYDGSRRSGPVVSKDGISAMNSPKMKQNGDAIQAQPVSDPRYGSKMRVSGNGYQNMKAVKNDANRAKEEASPSVHPIKGTPGIVARATKEEHSPNRFAAQLKEKREKKKR